MDTITKKDLCDRIADKYHFRTVLTKEIVQLFLDEIITELEKGNRLEFRDFGVFEPKSQGPRIAHNPKTFEKVDVPAKRSVKFKMGRIMKQEMNGEKNLKGIGYKKSPAGAEPF